MQKRTGSRTVSNYQRSPRTEEPPVSTEAVEGRTPARRNAGEEATSRIQSREKVSFGLEGVRRRAKTDKTCCFTALLHHISPELLRQSFYELNRKAMPGIDGMTWQDYEKQLEERLPKLQSRGRCSVTTISLMEHAYSIEGRNID